MRNKRVFISNTAIQARMAELGINASELARRSGLSHNYISEILNAKRGKRPSFDTIEALKKGLRVKREFFCQTESHMRNTVQES